MSVDDPTEERECPLCLEKLEIDDLYFYPCTCKYQVCRFCWHRIRMDENGLCPACRKPYPEDPANFQPITPLEMQQKRKQKEKKKNISECRKHLSAYRVLQRNLVYVVGLSPRIADPEILKRSDYFGKYGKVVKVAVGTLPSSQGNAPVHTAYVTFGRVEDALKTIQETNSLVFDGRMIKTSLGTTKYCSNFLRGQACNKQECMYLHEVAPPELSFTKEDMHQGKHTEYEKKLLEKMAEQMEAAAATSAKEESEAAAKLGPFPEDENGGVEVAQEEQQETHSSTDERTGTPEKEELDRSSTTESQPPSTGHDDSIETDFPPIENVKIVDPVFPDEAEPVVAYSKSPPLFQPTSSSQKYEDDLGFDPFAESMKGLEELMRETETQNQHQHQSYHYEAPPMHHDNDPVSRLLFGAERPPMEGFQPSSYSHNSMHNSYSNGPYRSDMERPSMDFSSSPFGSYQNGFHNPSQQSSHFQRQTSQSQEKAYFNSNAAFNNYIMSRNSSTLPDSPAYQPYRSEQSSFMPSSHESRDAFKRMFPDINVSFVSSQVSESRNSFSTSPNQYGQQSSNAFQRQMYRGSGMEYGFPMSSHSHMSFTPEPPGFSSTSKYMTTPPPGFDSANHGQGPN